MCARRCDAAGGVQKKPERALRLANGDGKPQLGGWRLLLFGHDKSCDQASWNPVNEPMGIQMLKEARAIDHGREAPEEEPEEQRKHAW